MRTGENSGSMLLDLLPIKAARKNRIAGGDSILSEAAFQGAPAINDQGDHQRNDTASRARKNQTSLTDRVTTSEGNNANFPQAFARSRKICCSVIDTIAIAGRDAQNDQLSSSGDFQT
jgi:hypothetical protein